METGLGAINSLTKCCLHTHHVVESDACIYVSTMSLIIQKLKRFGGAVQAIFVYFFIL